MLERRVDSNDANAIYQLGAMHLVGDEELNIKKDINQAIRLFHRAAELVLNRQTGKAAITDVVSNLCYLTCYTQMRAAGNGWL